MLAKLQVKSCIQFHCNGLDLSAPLWLHSSKNDLTATRVLVRHDRPGWQENVWHETSECLFQLFTNFVKNPSGCATTCGSFYRWCSTSTAAREHSFANSVEMILVQLPDGAGGQNGGRFPVSYTHLTLPTIYSV